jgi:hypothetical protein
MGITGQMIGGEKFQQTYLIEVFQSYYVSLEKFGKISQNRIISIKTQPEPKYDCENNL